jgi:hypothetical protein
VTRGEAIQTGIFALARWHLQDDGDRCRRLEGEKFGFQAAVVVDALAAKGCTSTGTKGRAGRDHLARQLRGGLKLRKEATSSSPIPPESSRSDRIRDRVAGLGHGQTVAAALQSGTFRGRANAAPWVLPPADMARVHSNWGRNLPLHAGVNWL